MSVTGTTLHRRISSPVYGHLVSLSDDIGLFEHADGDVPRQEHGYCVDDVARALIVAVREPSDQLTALATTSLEFLARAIGDGGRSHNRMSVTGEWTDEPDLGDWWGRSAWALGTAAARNPDLRWRARAHFMRLAATRSPHVRSMAFAALGAAELVLAGDRDRRLVYLLLDALDIVPQQPTNVWAWPEDRLRYGNGSLAEAVIAAGAALEKPAVLEGGLAMLDALLDLETRDDHLSVAGTAGRGPADIAAQFDQQPIEIAAIADAAARAHDITGDPRWLNAVGLAWRWFLGTNDSATPMVDLATGAGYDGLERTGRNDNRGAESTLAALSTWQHAHRLGVLEQ